MCCHRVEYRECVMQWLRRLVIVNLLGVTAVVLPAQQEAETLIRGGW